MVEKILNTAARTRLEVAALQRTISLFWETLLVSTNSRVLTAAVDKCIDAWTIFKST